MNGHVLGPAFPQAAPTLTGTAWGDGVIIWKDSISRVLQVKKHGSDRRGVGKAKPMMLSPRVVRYLPARSLRVSLILVGSVRSATHLTDPLTLPLFHFRQTNQDRSSSRPPTLVDLLPTHAHAKSTLHFFSVQQQKPGNLARPLGPSVNSISAWS